MDISPIPSDPIDLVSRLDVIEAQALPERADAYAALHDELAARLDADVTGGAARS